MMEINNPESAGLNVSWVGHVAHLVFDQVDSKVNKIDEAALALFEAWLDELEGRDHLDGVILSSAKPDSFIVGADVDQLRTLHSPAEAAGLSRRAHAAINRLRNVRAPTIAAIHGAAMGAGLEIALACRYRVATDHPSTRLALPEVRLGICPGAGGTQLLPQLIGLQRALPLLITGKPVYARQAARLGLVDGVCSPQLLIQTASGLLRSAPSETSRRSVPWLHRAIQVARPLRSIVFREAARRVRSETHGHYPAPFRIIDVVRTGIERGISHGLEEEAETFGELLFSPTSRALVSLFLAKRRGDRGPDDQVERTVESIGVLGAGLMGSGIADVSASSGFDVVVKDTDLSIATQAVKATMRSANRLVARRAISPFEAERRVTRVAPTTSYSALSHVDLVIEAVTEDVDLKHRVLREVEDVVPEHCILATNTSSIPLSVLRQPLARPERLIGMHYFSPVSRMPLIEIINQVDTPAAVLASVRETGLRQGKTVIIVNDTPGFYTTRVLALYLNEALLLMREGARVEHIDEAVRQFGFPMGPFEVFDLVGLDTAAKITSVLEFKFAEREVPVSDVASRLAAEGARGSNSGLGFYGYSERRTLKRGHRPVSRDEAIRKSTGMVAATSISPHDVLECLLMLFVNEAVRCLEENVLEDPRDGDLGAVFGLGFPPHTGGPFHYVDRESAQAVVLRLERLKLARGKRFEPSELLREMAGHGRVFHNHAPRPSGV